MLAKALFSLFFLSAPHAAQAVGALYARQDTPLLRSDPRIDVPATLQDPTKRNDGLYARQGTCIIGHACSTGGCCSGDCCGNGCCPIGYRCQYVGNSAGCCPIGRTCGSGISGCTSSNLVECANYDHCCPRGETCSLLNGNAHCSGQDSGSSGNNGNGNANTRTTTTYYSADITLNIPTTTRTSTTSTTSRTTSTTSKTSSTTRTTPTIDNATVSQAAFNGGYPRMVMSSVGIVCLTGLVVVLLV
ncbi:hypothetical protein M408DRAFT_331704 [Serendipita vermifera MAFF 305830]|uniref:Carbohydrate-binding module family 18 protein n=1 Tax=Serendipita vermifera MAFF 305830 TaxID=933852 RepID=A0A0C3AX89_SERVB|nr:hypothetical protein M408DRAFT_331704 [Serendipita vermifera MAFF 305830]